MHTRSVCDIRAGPRVVYDLAERIDRWAEILPHYRYVRVRREAPSSRLAVMSAWRGPLPVRWIGLQRCDPTVLRIYYRHVGGVTRGMIVEWSIQSAEWGTRVTVEHQLQAPSRLIPDWLLQRVVGDFFVGHIAGLTLGRIKALAESSSGIGAVA